MSLRDDERRLWRLEEKLKRVQSLVSKLRQKVARRKARRKERG